MSKKLTPWFPPEIKPVRNGVYQTKYLSQWTCKMLSGYSMWNGKDWSIQYSSRSTADGDIYSNGNADKYWRGLAEQLEMSDDELTRLRLENINLRRIVGEQGAHIERLNVMLLAAQQSASKAIEDEAMKAIQKASAK